MTGPHFPGWRKKLAQQRNNGRKGTSAHADPIYGASSQVKKAFSRTSENPDGSRTFYNPIKGWLVTRPVPGSRRTRAPTEKERRRWEKLFGNKK
jgi:hypothetical protein